jgi:hypothetical protein
MLEKMLLPENHAIAILTKDHDRVKELFDNTPRTADWAGLNGVLFSAPIEIRSEGCIDRCSPRAKNRASRNNGHSVLRSLIGWNNKPYSST